MRVPRAFAAALPEERGQELVLEGDEAVHLSRVLRLQPGAPVELFDGRGGAGRFRVVRVERRRLALALEELGGTARELPFALSCAVALPKAKRAQRLLAGLTELGMTRFVPLELSRSQNRVPRPEALERWCLEAAKQCGRNRLPGIDPAGGLEALLELGREHALALLPDPGGPPLRELLPAQPPASVLVAIGPEGGFSEEERAACAAAGFGRAALGPSVLRIETAACAVVGALLGAWA